MPGRTITVAYNPNILREALQARSLTPAKLSERLEIPVGRLLKEMGDTEPSQAFIKMVAKELGLPLFAFYMSKLPPTKEAIPDFREENATPGAKDRTTIEAIKLAEGIQKTLVDLGAPGITKLPKFAATSDGDIDGFARKIRSEFDLSLEDQRDAKDSRAFYVTVRKKVEDRGVVVLQDSFPREDGSGFCLAHAHHPVIVVNSNKQTRARRNFTLVHELAHVLMGSTGISDPFVRKNAIERRCSRFAGSFLVPGEWVYTLMQTNDVASDPDLDDVRAAAKKLKISQEATVLRLEQLGIYKRGSHGKWRELVHGNNPDFFEKGGGGKAPPEQAKVKLAKYGFQFAKAFKRLKEQGLIDEINLYRASGLKPKYQDDYFDLVNSLSSNELHGFELDDG
jgi:Zn-dependent peptidase ImmA (M78 family)